MKINIDLKFILVPSQYSHVSYGQLINCYKLDPKLCINAGNNENLRGLNLKDYIILNVVNGDYQKHLALQIGKFILRKIFNRNID